MNHNLQTKGYKQKTTSYELWYKLQATRYELWALRYKFWATSDTYINSCLCRLMTVRYDTWIVERLPGLSAPADDCTVCTVQVLYCTVRSSASISEIFFSTVIVRRLLFEGFCKLNQQVLYLPDVKMLKTGLFLLSLWCTFKINIEMLATR